MSFEQDRGKTQNPSHYFHSKSILSLTSGITVFCEIMPCRLLCRYLFKVYPEEGGNILLPILDVYKPNYTVSFPRISFANYCKLRRQNFRPHILKHSATNPPFCDL